MAKALVSRKKAEALSFALFLVGIGILFLLNSWWPGIALVVGIPLAVKQYLLGQRWDVFITLFILGGIFVTVQFKIPWDMLLPALFILGGFYIFIKEFFLRKPLDESEYEEDIKHEIEEDQEK